jgi:hypothetical protein
MASLVRLQSVQVWQRDERGNHVRNMPQAQGLSISFCYGHCVLFGRFSGLPDL